MRPIDADKLEYKEVIELMRDRDGMIYPLHYLVVKKTDIMCAPILDVAPVKHGEWKMDKNNGLCYCTICDTVTPISDAYGEYCGCPNYCPNCGAKMDGRKIDDLS